MANRNGAPIWFELATTDQDAAQDFYTKVAGWSVRVSPMPEHGGYRLAAAPDGAMIAGLMTPPPGMDGTPGWQLYFASDDVDAMAERVKALGGQVHFGPMDIPHVGRFAVVADPQGVGFNIMKGASPEDATAFMMPEPGSDASVGHAVWTELATPDPDGAFDFYGQLFGWVKGGAMPMGEMGEYAFIGAPNTSEVCPEGEPVGPGAIMSSTRTGAPARWNWYVHVPDIDAAIYTAKANGGALLQGPDQIPGGDYSANLTDDGGHQIGLVGPRKQGA